MRYNKIYSTNIQEEEEMYEKEKNYHLHCDVCFIGFTMWNIFHLR